MSTPITATAGSAPVARSGAARWALLLLTTIATVQFFDRALMVVILEPMAGSAGSFATLVAARVGIGAMDAGGQPCSVSMIADLYPPQRRATAVAVFYMGVPLGMAGGFLFGALLAGAYGWRTALFVAAVPGLVLAALLLLLLREPGRGGSEPAPSAAAAVAAPPLAETLRFMRGQRALLHLMAASVLVTASSSAMMSWIASLLMRSHGLAIERVGLVSAICMGGFGAIGTLLFGIAADRLGARDMALQPRLMAWQAAAIALFGSAVCLWPGWLGAAVALALFAACVAGLNGPTYALTQTLVRVRMRGTSMSVLVVLLNLIGVGVGPTLAGILSDVFASRFGADSVRWAMVCVLAANLPAVWLFLRAARAMLAKVGLRPEHYERYGRPPATATSTTAGSSPATPPTAASCSRRRWACTRTGR